MDSLIKLLKENDMAANIFTVVGIAIMLLIALC
jgi:hypothetical protein